MPAEEFRFRAGEGRKKEPLSKQLPRGSFSSVRNFRVIGSCKLVIDLVSSASGGTRQSSGTGPSDCWRILLRLHHHVDSSRLWPDIECTPRSKGTDFAQPDHMSGGGA